MAGSHPRFLRGITCAAFSLLAWAPDASARDSLGVFGQWGAFRDANVPRCHAIAMPDAGGARSAYRPYADVAVWPRRNIRNQVHFRLARPVDAGRRIVLAIGAQRFVLTGGGGDAWAADRRMDAAIVAAMRSASGMTITAHAASGQQFSHNWRLDGAASAMDAAAIGCARLK